MASDVIPIKEIGTEDLHEKLRNLISRYIDGASRGPQKARRRMRDVLQVGGRTTPISFLTREEVLDLIPKLEKELQKEGI